MPVSTTDRAAGFTPRDPSPNHWLPSNDGHMTHLHEGEHIPRHQRESPGPAYVNVFGLHARSHTDSDPRESGSKVGMASFASTTPRQKGPPMSTWWERRDAHKAAKKEQRRIAEAERRFKQREAAKREQERLAKIRKDAERELTLRLRALHAQDRAGEMFTQFDADGSGGIDFAEFCCVMTEAMGKHIPLMQLHVLFSTVDEDQSGVIDYDEFMQWFTGVEDFPKLLQRAADKVYELMDEDHDEELGFREFRKLVRVFAKVKISRNKLLALFIELDEDGSGSVDKVRSAEPSRVVRFVCMWRSLRT